MTGGLRLDFRFCCRVLVCGLYWFPWCGFVVVDMLNLLVLVWVFGGFGWFCVITVGDVFAVI